MALVQVRPIPVERWHGKKGKDSFARPKTIEVLYDNETGAFATGLTPEEAEEYGKKMGKDLSDRWTESPHPYWSSQVAQINLPNHTMFFDAKKDTDWIKIKNMRASKYVANSLEEYDSGGWPFATHYIFDENEEVAVKATKIDKKKKAYQLIATMTVEDKINLVQSISDIVVRGRSESFIDVKLDELIDKDTDKVLGYAVLDKVQLNSLSLIHEGMQKGVFTVEAGIFTYMDANMGANEDEATVWLNDPKNQQVKATIINKLAGK